MTSYNRVNRSKLQYSLKLHCPIFEGVVYVNSVQILYPWYSLYILMGYYIAMFYTIYLWDISLFNRKTRRIIDIMLSSDGVKLR